MAFVRRRHLSPDLNFENEPGMRGGFQAEATPGGGWRLQPVGVWLAGGGGTGDRALRPATMLVGK